jgi:hypothetical protein
LLKVGLEIERRQRLGNEVAAFFAEDPDDRTARTAFQKASVRAISRD